jgi:hypothetical protein
VVALGLMDPLPAQVLAEVNVQLPHTAVLLRGAAGRRNTGEEYAQAMRVTQPSPHHAVPCTL